jgi:hypothetical protein
VSGAPIVAKLHVLTVGKTPMLSSAPAGIAEGVITNTTDPSGRRCGETT